MVNCTFPLFALAGLSRVLPGYLTANYRDRISTALISIAGRSETFYWRPPALTFLAIKYTWVYFVTAVTRARALGIREVREILKHLRCEIGRG